MVGLFDLASIADGLDVGAGAATYDAWYGMVGVFGALCGFAVFFVFGSLLSFFREGTFL